MDDISSEHIVLSPDEIQDRSSEVSASYHAQAQQARERFTRYQGKLVDRWEDQQKAQELFNSFSLTGALKLTQGESESLQDSPLKRFLLTPSDRYTGSYRYQLSHGNEIYLRAEDYYQFYDRQQTALQRIEMSQASIDALMTAYPAIHDYIVEKPDLPLNELKVYLAFLDHVKIELLRVYHAYVYLRTMQADNNSGEVLVIEKALKAVIDAYYSILDGEPVKALSIDWQAVQESCMHIKEVIETKTLQDRDLKGVMRGLPESDNPLRNKVYAMAFVDRVKDQDTGNMVLGGIHFGGAELPWVLSQEIERQKLRQPEILAVHYSRYTHQKDQQEQFWDHVDRRVDVGKALYLIDDGVYSGGSLQTLIKLAQAAGFREVKVSVQMLANSRQMGRMTVKGGVNPDFVENHLVDAIGVSPFFRARTAQEYRTLKEKGRFNIVAEKVRRMLVSSYPADKAVGNDIFKNLRDA